MQTPSRWLTPTPSHFVDQAFPAKTIASQPIHETDPIRVTKPVLGRVAGSDSSWAPLPCLPFDWKQVRRHCPVTTCDNERRVARTRHPVVAGDQQLLILRRCPRPARLP